MIRLSRSIVGKDEVDAVSRVILEDGYLGMGREVQLFESEIADFLNVPKEWVVCVSSGTAALHLATQAITKPGDAVLVQSLTYVATYQAITAAGALPISCEVRPETVTIDLSDAQSRITSRTKVVMPVHYASNPRDLDSIYDFAKQNNLRVIEDAAHAFGCSYKGKKIGSFGDIVCFSFDGIKNITSGEGGAVVTGDHLVAEKIRNARLLGVEKDTEKRYSAQRSWDFDVREQGYRYHMSNIFAAIGRAQLKRFDAEFAPKRVSLAGLYRRKLENVPHLNLLDTNLEEIIPHIQPMLVHDGLRDALIKHMEDEGIQTGIHYKPNHFLHYYNDVGLKLPVTEKLYSELVSLPLHPAITEDDIEYITSTVRGYLQRQ